MAKRGRPVGARSKASDASPTNGLDIETVDSFVERIEDLDAEGRTMHAEYMKERKSLVEDKNETYKRAKAAGIPTEVLRVTVEQRALDRRAAALPDKLASDNRYLFDDFQARWDSIKAGRGDPGPGVLVKPPVVEVGTDPNKEPVQPIGRTEPVEPEKESA